MIALALPFLQPACTDPPPQPECATHDHCAEGEACMDGFCSAVECIASSQCEFGRYCTDAYTCAEGCGTDEDCLAGTSCDLSSNQCRSYGCRDTHLDCDLGEFCDTETGLCYQAEGEICDPCGYTSCGAESTCYDYGLQGNPEQMFCLPSCDIDDPNACPRGFSCQVLWGHPNTGCYGDCAWLTMHGYL